ncbi:MAG: hypothetical protein ACREPI_12280, partial [Candidatus Dormibacterales bacterium]
MQSARAGFRLRPLPLSDLLDETFSLYRANFVVLAVTAFLVSLPSVVVSFLSGEALFGWGQLAGSLRGSGPSAGAVTLTPALSAWAGVNVIVGLIMVPFTAAALFLGSADVALGRPVAVESILRGVLRRYFSIWVVVLIFVVGVIALLIPPLGIWLLVRWSVALPALFSEERGPGAAAGRSWSLVGGHWWRTFGRLIVVYIVVGVLTLILGSLLGIVAGLPGLSVEMQAGFSALARVVAGSLLGPVTAIAVTLIYFDLRVRKEGIDLHQMAREAGAGGPGFPGGSTGGWSSPPPSPPPS